MVRSSMTGILKKRGCLSAHPQRDGRLHAKEEASGETALLATFLDLVLDLVLEGSWTIRLELFCLGDGSLLVEWGQAQYLNLRVSNPSLGKDRAETQSRS